MEQKTPYHTSTQEIDNLIELRKQYEQAEQEYKRAVGDFYDNHTFNKDERIDMSDTEVVYCTPYRMFHYEGDTRYRQLLNDKDVIEGEIRRRQEYLRRVQDEHGHCPFLAETRHILIYAVFREGRAKRRYLIPTGFYKDKPPIKMKRYEKKQEKSKA